MSLTAGRWTNGALICVIALAVTMVGCEGCNPAPEPTPEPRSVELADASSQDGLSYELSGTGDSGNMKLRVTNRSNRIWLVHVEEGLKLEPAEGGVQNMVVTKELHVTMHPHDHQELDLEVACLDISKAPPGPTHTSWTVRRSTNLPQFMKCVNGVVDELKTSDPAHSEQFEQNRGAVLQLSLWKARGATRQDWVEFYTKYHDMSDEQAQQETDAMEPVLNAVVNQCGALQ